jgi:integrase
MFNMAQKWDLYHGPNPVRIVKFLPENNLKFQTLSEAEEKALLAACPPYLQDMIVFAINTGLRPGDIFNLRWEDVDLEQERLKLKVKKTERLLELPLSDQASAVVERRYAIRRGPFVFYNPMTGDRFWDVKLGLKGASKRAGLEGVTWHIFRHTFASRLIQAGADIVTVKRAFGHSTVTVTMRYAHTNIETKTRAVEMLNRSDKQ